MKKLLSLIILFCLISLVAAKSYSIQSAQVDYYLNPDGTVRVTERITYSLSGSFTELFRQLPTDMKILNSSGYCEGKQCTFYTQLNQGYFELVLKSNYVNEQVTVFFDYVIDDQILAQKDASQFFYKLWGDKSEEGIGKLTATVHLPGSTSGTKYFIHPASEKITATANGNEIMINSFSHPAKTYLEINLLMPQSWFSNLPQAKNYMTKQEIETGEKEYTEDLKTFGMLFFLFSLAMSLVLPIFFLINYWFYGREKPIESLGFFGPYEHEPPSDLSPAEAQYLLDHSVNSNSLSGELLYLVQKKYLKMEEIEIEVAELLGKKKKKVICFSIIEEQNIEQLKSYQKNILNFIKNSFNGRFIAEEVQKKNKSLEYATFYRSFEREILQEFGKRNYMNNKGNNNVFIASFIMFFASIFTAQIIVSIEAFILIILVARKPQILGKWTDEGRVQEHRWNNFKKYLSDMTLMREKKPDSIVLWELYLVYATAFGVSEKTIKAMKLYVPGKEQRNSEILATSVYFGSFTHSLSSVTSTATASRSGSSHGGFGGGGGGGGGGCGAR